MGQSILMNPDFSNRLKLILENCMTKINIYFRVLDETTVPIVNAIRKDKLPVKIWFPENDNGYRVTYRIRDIQTINHNDTDNAVGCYIWEIGNCSVTPVYDGTNHILTHINIHNRNFICVDSQVPARGYITLFQDCLHLQDYPDNFHRIKVFNDYNILKSYIDGISLPFSLDNGTIFKRTAYQFQGQTIYQEIRTKHYWYLDNFHKYHYEVFDSNKKHIGEANTEGHIDTSKCDKSKRLPI